RSKRDWSSDVCSSDLTSSPPFVWVESMNELYKGLEMSQIRLSDDQALPLLDRLQANSRDYIAGPKVSIIMPTFSPGPGIRTAIRSRSEERRVGKECRWRGRT